MHIRAFLADDLYAVEKRMVDVALSVLLLAVFWWLLLLIAVVIKLDAPHAPVFYSQTRVGLEGKLFRMWKFRTMVPGADVMLQELQQHNEKDGPAFKLKDDPRVTRVGRFLRRTSLDELPQLFNTVRGEMSLVGPRPPLPTEYRQYTEQQKQRLTVKPGLTCYWQVQPNRDDLSFDCWMALDMRYVKERSPGTDARILCRTVGAVLGGHGR